MNYHHTTAVDAGTRAEYERKAQGQEAIVLDLFCASFPARLSPEQVRDRVLSDAPLTSVRRAISNLTRAGVLRKCEEHVIGDYGRPVHVWQWVSEEPKPGRTFSQVVEDAEAVQGMLF
jgi:hypothetical protein